MSAAATNLPAVIPADEEPRSSLFAEIINPKKRAFLIAFTQTSTIHSAVRLSGTHWSSHYHWMNPGPYYDPVYVKAFERAKKMSLDFREGAIIQRGFYGYEKAIVYKGKITGYTKEFSDLAALANLNAEMPDKYHRNPIADASAAPVTINIVSYSQTVQVSQAQAPAGEAIEGEKAEQVKITKW